MEFILKQKFVSKSASVYFPVVICSVKTAPDWIQNITMKSFDKWKAISDGHKLLQMTCFQHATQSQKIVGCCKLTNIFWEISNTCNMLWLSSAFCGHFQLRRKIVLIVWTVLLKFYVIWNLSINIFSEVPVTIFFA